ncbi:class I SAM-dependent methyltransferase [Candidatus Dependentiae bacterium]|nr:class I SAM-dependent methyltransferase [Candidatus Dependentiae bacterium]
MLNKKYLKKFFFLNTLFFMHSSKCIIDEESLYDAKNIDMQVATGLNENQLIPILNFLKKEETNCSWVEEYHIITDLLRNMNLKIGCEIGVAYGFQSKFFLENSSIVKLYSIDPYQHFGDYDDFMNFPQHYFDTLFYRVQKRLSIFDQRSVLLRKKSVEASSMFEDQSLDFVYIDANHSYKAVTEDLVAWVPKIRPGGLVSGDDYRVFPSTAKAVDEFVTKNNIKLHTFKNKWWFIKP